MSDIDHEPTLPLPEFEPKRDDFAQEIRESFGRQRVMSTIGADIVTVEPGRVEIALPFDEKLTQQDDFLHAGIVATILDSACGYAAFTLMPARTRVLTVEYKINLLAPAIGDRFIARGTVLRPGRRLTVCHGELDAITQEQRKPAALMIATMITLDDHADEPADGQPEEQPEAG